MERYFYFTVFLFCHLSEMFEPVHPFPHRSNYLALLSIQRCCLVDFFLTECIKGAPHYREKTEHQPLYHYVAGPGLTGEQILRARYGS